MGFPRSKCRAHRPGRGTAGAGHQSGHPALIFFLRRRFQVLDCRFRMPYTVLVDRESGEEGLKTAEGAVRTIPEEKAFDRMHNRLLFLGGL